MVGSRISRGIRCFAVRGFFGPAGQSNRSGSNCHSGVRQSLGLCTSGVHSRSISNFGSRYFLSFIRLPKKAALPGLAIFRSLNWLGINRRLHV